MSPSAKFQIRSDVVLSSAIVTSMLFLASASAVRPLAAPERAAFLGSAPLYFEAQSAESFMARGQDCSLLISATEATMILSEGEANVAAPSSRLNAGEHRSGSTGAVRMTLLGARSGGELTGIEQLPGKANYLLGDDSSAWRTGIPLFARVQAQQIYPGIDVIYYADQSAHLEYDFVLQPNAKPDQIAFRIEGADRVRIDARGDLVLKIGSQEIRQHKPVIYQDVNGVRKEIVGGYRLTGENTVAFRVGEYDHNLPLVIDPVMTFSTYLGGTKAENGWAIAVDGNGDVYVAGETLSKDLPVTSNAYTNRYAGGYGSFGDAFIAKYDAVSNALVYLTYFGGRANDSAMALAVTNGNVFVTGFTDSRNFPVVPANNPVALETLAHSGRTNNAFRLYPVNVFVAEFDATGSSLVFSTLIGGNRRETGTGIALDGSENVYVTGMTESTNFPTKWPVNSSGIQTNYGGRGDAFVFALSPNGTNLLYSTFIGGTNLDFAESIAVNANGEAYITGYTTSTNFPGTANAITFTNATGFFTNGLTLDRLNMQTKPTSHFDAFVAKLSVFGTNLLYGTYLGGTNDDLGEHIAVDSSGNAYVTGYTYSRVFPTNAIAAPMSTGTNNFTSHIFVAKIGTDTPPDLLYSVQFGSKGTDRATGIAVDEANQRVYVTGYTTRTNFFATNVYTDLRSANAIKRKSSGTPNDGFIAVLQEGPGNAVSFSTNCVLFGGQRSDLPHGIVIRPEGPNMAAYVVGQTLSTDFVVTNSVDSALVQTNLGNGKKKKSSDAFVSKFLFP